MKQRGKKATHEILEINIGGLLRRCRIGPVVDQAVDQSLRA